MALDLDWVARVQANTSAIERRAVSLPGRRSVKKDYQAAWLLKAVTCIDLTTLSGDDTARRVERLCAKARQHNAWNMLVRTAAVVEEIFGPVLPIVRVADYEEALKVANDRPHLN